MKDYKNIVKAYIDSHKLMTPNDRILVALSGGADSVGLMLFLIDLGYYIEAAHCNFHLRGNESMRDESFVTNLCVIKNVVLHKTDFNTQEYAKTHGVSIEMAARDLRYQYFDSVMKKHSLSILAVGHHRDDNAETMLLNIVRGTGIQGVCGIMPKNDMNVVRPLLCLKHEEIVEYLRECKQSYVTDSSNFKSDVSRNKIRLDVMPILKTINPGATNNINTTIDNLNEVRKVYEAAIKADIKRCATTSEETAYIDMKSLMTCTSPISVLHAIASPKGFNRTQEQEMLISAQGKVWISDEWKALTDRGHIIFSKKNSISNTVITKSIIDIAELIIIKDKNIAYIDADKIIGTIKIRKVNVGDSFQPFGMKGRKLLSDFLTDLKKSRFEKEEQLVVCDDKDILWVVNERASEKYRVDEKTKRVLVLKSK